MADESLDDEVYIEQDSKISILKTSLISHLAELMEEQRDKEEFIIMCSRAEATVRAWYNRQFEEMMQIYQLFNPLDGKLKLERLNLPAETVDKLEERFLVLLFEVMKKSQYKLLSDQELEIATSGKYMLDFSVEVDPKKLDKRMLSNFISQHPEIRMPSFSNQYLMFRRGLGIDTTTGMFMNGKIDLVLSKVWNVLLTAVGLRKKSLKKKKDDVAVIRKFHVDGSSEKVSAIERKNLDSMHLTWKNVILPVTLQEPTFERVILVYRKATPPKFDSKLGDRNIHVKQFHNIPMADLEVCYPEKSSPKLSPMDILQLVISVVGGLYAIFASMEQQVSEAYVYAIIVAVVGYLSKLYFSWQESMEKYQNLITQSMYDKHMDSGRGTLLHLCDDVIQQEVKEVIIAYFVLITQGKATYQVLDERCEQLLLEEFSEGIDFGVHDAMDKLLRLGIVTKNASGQVIHKSLKQANEIMGVTTEEFVSRVNK